MQEEIWKDIPNYEGIYQVSNLGNIKSLSRTMKFGNNLRKTKDVILSPRVTNKGYLFVTIYNGIDKYGKNKTIHQLVAMAFLGHIPCGHNLVIDHINDIKTDNRVENLQIVTNRFNTRKTQGKGTSIYKGVCWNKKMKKWASQIVINKIDKHIGYFNCELKAHLAYQNKLKEIENG